MVLEEPLLIVHVRQAVDEDYERGIDDVYLDRALYQSAVIKDVVGEVSSRLEHGKRLRDARSIKREAVVVVHKLIWPRYTGLFEKCILPFFVPPDEEIVPFLFERDIERSIYLSFKPYAAFFIIVINRPHLVIAALSKPKRIKKSKSVSLRMRIDDVYAEIREVPIHE